MKRKLKAFLMAVLMLFTTIATLLGDVSVVRADDLVLKLHYEREDGNYTDWSVWFWEAGKEGVDTPFSEENGEMVATITVTPGTSSVGFIVRTPDWTKDVDMDQFIDITECVSGTVHVYVKSGVEGFTKEYGDDMVIGTKLSSAVYADHGRAVRMTERLDERAKAYTIGGKEGDIAIAAITGNGPSYTIELENELDLSKDYTITFD